MLKSVILCLVSLLLVEAFDLEKLAQDEWTAFKVRYNKSYDEREEKFRMKVFLDNRHQIARHNYKSANGYRSYSLGLNKYSDMLHSEFIQTMNGYKKELRSSRPEEGSTYLSPANVVLPPSVDWRDKGFVTPVKDQGHCGSCWAFASTGALEGQHFKKTGRLISLSEQNLVDCSRKFGNMGCEGGLPDYAYTYVKKNHGIDTEKSYPYKAKDSMCHFNKRNVGATDSGFVDLPEGDVKALKEAVATIGPISVAIDASHQSFQFYEDGIYDEPECSSENLDHAVLVVGYGVEDGVEYWLIKNSWGTSWGNNGYVKIKMDNNTCGVATNPSYPLV